MVNKILHSASAKLQLDTQLPSQNIHRIPLLSRRQEAFVVNGSTFTVVTTANGMVKESRSIPGQQGV
jgi:hypothetical protein